MKISKFVNLAVIVSSLGYFVDIYDLLLFIIVRKQSLEALQIPPEKILDVGSMLLNVQMMGLLLGGLIWGVLGDKRGRLSVLFGSILLYSVANIANAFVTSIGGYAAARFFAGLGLAGELGAAITLVSEVMSAETRGYGTTIVAAVGVLGAIAAALVGKIFSWNIAYLIGGGLGVLLLILRISMRESDLFRSLKDRKARRGDLWILVSNGRRFVRYLCSILIGVPIWYVIGTLIAFAPEFAKELHVHGEISSGYAVLFSYLGLSIGDFATGFVSQMIGNRKKVLFVSIAFTAFCSALYFFWAGMRTTDFYFLCTLLGIASGYWAIFVTVAAEQFGTNMRATVTTTVPNFVRGSVVLINIAFRKLIPALGLIGSAVAVGVIVFVVALGSVSQMEETYGKDLNFIEN